MNIFKIEIKFIYKVRIGKICILFFSFQKFLCLFNDILNE